MLILLNVNLELKSNAFMVMLHFALFVCIFPLQMFCGIHPDRPFPACLGRSV